ncbi:MAG: alanine racemase [Caldithrix sp.]|nr:MAG: alanine racemase [Caldithrix sp.]TDI92578.1 MAG: alanine racemase [Caldithrix sp.]
MSFRATWAEINLGAIAHNLQEIKRKVAPAEIMAVIKADAYGHGLKEVARVALENNARYLGVSTVEEGVQLRKQTTTPILVFGGFFENQIKACLEHDLELTLFDFERAGALSKQAQASGNSAKVHIKVDTGMTRVGVHWQESLDFICRVSELRYVKIVGIYTHFASADAKDKSFAKTQLQRFQKVLTELEMRNIQIPLKHTANSGAILDLPESYFDMVRPGVSIYGYYPSFEATESINLQPAMSFKSQVVAVKQVESGTKISYDSTYETVKQTKIVTVPVGYADGYNRLLSNQGEVLIRGKRYPVVGQVCMDFIMVDIGLENDIQTGDEVVLLGCQGDEEISIYEICEKLNTIPYEFTCMISSRVPRVYKSRMS